MLRLESVKLLEENIGSTLFDMDVNNILLGMFPQARETKAKINKWDYSKLKSFCTEKETINKKKDSLLNRKRYLQTIYLITS